MLTCGLTDLRRLFPRLRYIDDLTLVPIFHAAIQSFRDYMWQCARVKSKDLPLTTRRANVAAAENSILARDYKADFSGPEAAEYLARFTRFLESLELDALVDAARHDLLLVSRHLLSDEALWFYFGPGAAEAGAPPEFEEAAAG